MSFKLDLRIQGCNRLDTFSEGVELSVGIQNCSTWIPLHYFANNLQTSTDINIGLLNTDTRTVQIRGYSVPYSIQGGNDELLSVNLSVCGERVLQDGLQFRWLQTAQIMTTSSNNHHKDNIVTLDDVLISLAFENQTRKPLIREEFNSSNMER